MARWLRSRIEVPLERERLELDDGDFLDLDFAYSRPAAGGEGPIVVVLHGLEGSARSGYALAIYRFLRERGLCGVGLNFRSCSGEMNRLARLYHSGDTADLERVLAVLSERYPRRRLGAIGVSIGGNVLLKYLGTSGAGDGDGRVRAAAAISVPFDLAAGAEHLRRPQAAIYNRYLLGKLRRKAEAKRDLLPPGVDLQRALAARCFREFDDAATAPLHGFRGAEHYYSESSSARYLAGILVPTLLVHALDDPFFPRDRLPLGAAGSNPNLVTAFTERGGHVGFVSGSSPLRPVFWAEREAVRFVAAVLAAAPPQGQTS